MGCGVEQDETFAQIIEKYTGLKVLNAAISSYGTVREMKCLNRINTSNLKYLIIQYCENDYYENKSFYENKNKTYIETENDYLNFRKLYKKHKRYYPLKFTCILLNSFLRKNNKILDNNDRNIENEIKYFLNALIFASNVNLERIKIIVLYVGGPNQEEFITALKKEIESTKYPMYIQKIKVLPLEFKKENFLILDGHLNSLGHKFVADKLLECIKN